MASQIRGLVQQIDVVHAYNLFKLNYCGVWLYTEPIRSQKRE